MATPEKVNFVNGRFRSKRTENAFQASVFERNLTSNIWGLCLGLTWFVAYAFSDYIDTWNPHQAVMIRLGGGAIMFAALALLAFKRFQHHHNLIATGIVTMMGMAINAIIHLQPSLDNTYYIGIINGFIFFSLLLRLSFTSNAFAIVFTQACFMVVAFAKGEPQIAALQSANLGGVGVICVAGVYLLQRYQRADFLKTEIIQEQNQQLSKMLAVAERDKERKVAALNMLLHLVRTPIHQISGFTDLVLAHLEAELAPEKSSDCINNANYIKAASDDLCANISKLLAYHQLDEIERGPDFEDAPIKDIIYDALAPIDDDVSTSIDAQTSVVRADMRVLKISIDTLVNNIGGLGDQITALNVTVRDAGETTLVTFHDNGPGIDMEQFENAVRPLNEIDNYLTGFSNCPTMGLRTVARAMETCGGALTYAYDKGAVFTLHFPKSAPASPSIDPPNLNVIAA